VFFRILSSASICRRLAATAASIAALLASGMPRCAFAREWRERDLYLAELALAKSLSGSASKTSKNLILSPMCTEAVC
jgi:hypothetical protein